ncbi:extracellular solute-binding protein [Paenibacillus sp. GYB006]|uniref:extracellular solute-binding protein n=1 Tax=Paenibacillus sp. GYB006 TaxID=2994394 RepID=UPI002F96912C
MKRWKRFGLAGLLSVSLVATGCSSNGKVNNDAEKRGEDDPIVIMTNASTWDMPTEDDNPTQKYLEERFNVRFVNMRGNDENFKVKVASGEIPDIFPHNISEADMTNWARQGVIASISIDEIKKYMPTYVKEVEEIDPSAWDVGIIDGKNYGVPRIWLNGSYGFIPTYNGDWLKAIGYNEAPKTLEELEDVFTKFRNNDPDGNGKMDTYGMSGRGKDVRAQMFNSIYAAYGVNPYQFMLTDEGTVTWGGITDEAKEATKLLRKWYTEGLIDPEFMTDNGELIGQKWSSHKIGYVDNSMYHHLFGGMEADKTNGTNPVYGKGLIGPAGESLVMSNGALQVPLIFGKQVEEDDAKRIRILQILEEMTSVDEVYLRTVFGEEGVSYDLTNDAVVMKEPYASSPDDARLMGFGGYYNPLVERDSSMWKYHFTKEKLEFRETANEGMKTISDVLGPTSLESKGMYWATLITLQDEFYTKAIIENNDLDAVFEAFKEKWLKSGGQQVLDEATEVYKARQEAK